MNALSGVALVAGVGLPVQVALNAQLRDRVGSPLVAAVISFLVGLAVLCVAVAVAREPVPGASQLGGTAWWMWLGGVCGAFYVGMSIVLLPRLGAAVTIGFALAGQLLASLLLDQFGWIGVPQHPLNPGRVAGAVLLIAGIVLIQRF